MSTLPEEKIVAYLEQCHRLALAVLPLLPAKGTLMAEGPALEGFRTLVAELHAERERDAYLSDDSWSWIWKDKPSYNYLQVYGRLAWMNLQLFDLL